MKAQFKDMPPLGPGEAPWAEHESELRAMLNAAEETPPEGLEARVWEALDAQTPHATNANRTPWVAAAIAGGVVIASLWMTSGDGSQQSSSPLPVEVSSERLDEPATQPSLKETVEATLSGEEINEPGQVEVARKAPEAPAQTQVEVFDRARLEVMTGLESTTIPAKLDLNRTPIQSSQIQNDTVRLKGTLKLKQ